MSRGQVILWVLGAVTLIGVLIFVAIFVKFLARNTVSYLKHKPYPALAVFTISGGLSSFIAAFLGAAPLVAVLTGLAIGIAVLLLVAMELGTD